MAQTTGYADHLSTNSSILLGGIGDPRKFLLGVTVNKVGGTPNQLTVYDGLTSAGTVIAVIDTTTALGTFLYDIVAVRGLFCVLAGGTPADITISSY